MFANLDLLIFHSITFRENHNVVIIKKSGYFPSGENFIMGFFKRRNKRLFVILCAVPVLALLCWLTGCLTFGIRPPAGLVPREVLIETSGYCNCGKCCNWRRTWFGLGPAVIATGPNAGQPKQVGITASGTHARHGTLAADTAIYPFGTIMYIPGYGYGKVEDRGGLIKGGKLDLWFSSHDEAVKWGRKKVYVKVWRK